jgi:hypothetical protein
MLGIGLLLVAAAAVAAPPPAQSWEAAVGPNLAQVRTFAAGEGERVWPGYGQAAFGFLLVTDSEETLLCRDEAPAGFVSSGLDKATQCKAFTRARSGLPGTLLAAMPLFGPPSVIVMGTPQTTGRTEAAWVRTILHEHFHQWQYELADYFSRIRALDLQGGDETGMWILNYDFPYGDAGVVAAFDQASRRLAEAVAARGTPRFGSAFDSYLDARHALAERAGERNWRYFDFQLWQEGAARWTEIRLGKWYPRQDVRDSAARLEQATLDELGTQKLSEKKREAVYAYGAAEAMLLQACWPEWRAAYPSHLALGPLLDAAKETCGSRQ